MHSCFFPSGGEDESQTRPRTFFVLLAVEAVVLQGKVAWVSKVNRHSKGVWLWELDGSVEGFEDSLGARVCEVCLRMSNRFAHEALEMTGQCVLRRSKCIRKDAEEESSSKHHWRICCWSIR